MGNKLTASLSGFGVVRAYFPAKRIAKKIKGVFKLPSTYNISINKGFLGAKNTLNVLS